MQLKVLLHNCCNTKQLNGLLQLQFHCKAVSARWETGVLLLVCGNVMS
jgi:hypothetical protein